MRLRYEIRKMRWPITDETLRTYVSFPHDGQERAAIFETLIQGDTAFLVKEWDVFEDGSRKPGVFLRVLKNSLQIAPDTELRYEFSVFSDIDILELPLGHTPASVDYFPNQYFSEVPEIRVD